MNKHLLAGIQPEPLASYLAGLGIIRVLGEQADPQLSAWWDPAGLVIETTVDDLEAWLADSFVPTPVLRPWNPGSGFGISDEPPSGELAALLALPTSRLDPYRRTLEAAHAAARAVGWVSKKGAKGKEERQWPSGKNTEVVREFRNRCPQEALAWLDAAVVLADDDIHYPPLLGTGGNDGRFDFVGNLHQRLVEVLDPKSAVRARALLRDLLAGTQTAPLVAAAVGQFDPAAAGGRNSSPFGDGLAESLVNPWTFVLMIEGSMMFAAVASHRNVHEAGRAAMPFTVAASPDGSASGADEQSRGEVWAPLWDRRFAYAEIRQLFGEARAAWRGKPAQRAVDFYAATRTLGVARGLTAFTRFAIHQRNGQAHVAVPIERVRVTPKPSVRLAGTFDDWVKRAGGGASAAVRQAVRAYEKAQMAFAKEGDARTLGRLLAAVTDVELAVARSGRARENMSVLRPPNAGPFLAVLAAEECPELRVAVGIASCATDSRRTQGPSRSMRQLLLPVEPARPHQRWRPAAIVTGFGIRPLTHVLADVITWLARSAMVEESAGKRSVRGVLGFRRGILTPAADLHLFAQDLLRQDELTLWLKACLALDWRGVTHRWSYPGLPAQPLPLLGILHAFAAGLSPSDAGATEPALALDPAWPALLVAGHGPRVHADAVGRLRRLGWVAADPWPGIHHDDIALAAALVPRCATSRDVLKAIAVPLRDDQPSADIETTDEHEPDNEEELS